jgi:diguanylate cyclase (GGDEF)-like protein/PAS domain S-box-containing protein
MACDTARLSGVAAGPHRYPMPLQEKHAIAEIALQIRQSLDLATIWQTTVDAVQQLLGCDRALLYQFAADQSGQVVVEAVLDPQWSILGQTVHDPCFEASWLTPYDERQARAIADVATANLTPCHAEFLAGFQVKANLVVPVLCEARLWGLLIAHNCSAPRDWLPEEIATLQQLAVQVGIAIYQADLVAQLQATKVDLEAQVATRTAALEHANQQLVAQIADRNAIATDLQQREGFLRQVLDSLFAFVGVLTPEGILLEVNQATVNITGVTREEVVGQSFTEAYWWAYSARAQDQIRAAIAQANQGQAVRFDIEVQVRGGRFITIDFSLNPLSDATGHITHLIPSGIDITQRKHAELALRQSRDQRLQLAAIVESSQDAIISKTPEGIITSWNRAAERLFGYTAAEAIGQPITLIIPSEYQADAALIFQRLNQGQSIATYETQRQCKDGRRVEVALTTSSVQDETGTVIGVSKIARDITAQRQAQRALQEQTAILHSFYNSSPRMMGVVELSDHDILNISANQATATFFNTTVKALEGQWASALGVSPDLIQTWMGHYHQSQALGQPVQFDYAHTTETQATWLSVVVSYIGLGESQRPRFSYVAADISDRKQVEADLHHLNLVLENALEGIARLDLAGHYLSVNRAYAAICGYEPDALLGRVWASTVYAEDIPTLEAAYATMQATGKVKAEARGVRQDGSLFHKQVTMIADYDPQGVLVGHYCFLKDISDRKQAEADLRASEARWQFALEGSGDGIWDWNAQTNTVFFSRQWKAMLGYDEDEIGTSLDEWSSRVHPDDLEECYADLQRHFSGEVSMYQNEHRMRCKDGSYKWILDRGKVIEWSETGEPLRVIGTHSDVTERRQIQESLEEERRLFIGGPTIVIRWGTTPGWPIEYISPNVEAELGYPANDLLAENVTYLSLLHPEDVERVQTEVASATAAHKFSYTQTYRLRHANGGFRWIEDFTQVIYAADGSVKQFLGYIQDQTERRQADLALQRSEVRYRSIIETTLEGVWMLDAEGKTTFVNQQMANMLGYSVEAMAGTTLMDFIAPADQGEARAYLDRRQQGIEEKHPFKFCRKDQSVLWVLVSATPLLDENQDYGGCIGLLTDITQLITMQEALQTSEMQLSSVLDSSLDGIMAFRSVRDEQGTIVDFEWLLSNPTACDLVGRTEVDLLGKRLLEEMPGNREEGLFDGYVNTVETGVPYQREFYYDHDGIESWFESIAVKLEDGFAVTFRNVTTLKQSERALHQLNQQLEDRVTDLAQRHAEMLTLSEISDFLQSCSTVEEACHTITNLVETLFPGCAGGIFITRASRNRLEWVNGWGRQLPSNPNFEPHHCWGLRRGRMHYVGQDRLSLRCHHSQANEATATLCIPMMAQGETLGLLYLSTETPGELPEPKQQLARTLAEQLGMAIANLKLQETLRHQSIRDPLTGLYNRRYLEETLTQELIRAQRKQHSIGVMMIDIDHFKQFNDTFGHDVGDFVLQLVSTLLKESVRNSDIACRYGGEEMTLILPEANLAETTARAELLRSAISQLRPNYHGQSLAMLTASFGVAAFPQHGSTVQALIKAADDALYRAKASGRNQVCIAA